MAYYATHFIPHFVYFELIYIIINGVAELVFDPNVGAINQPNDTKESPFVCKKHLLFLAFDLL